MVRESPKSARKGVNGKEVSSTTNGLIINFLCFKKKYKGNLQVIADDFQHSIERMCQSIAGRSVQWGVEGG